jgi:pimeloyl-ACP methyl ester carboxylesterase
MPILQIDGQTVYYEILGPSNGDPVVLMHGFLQVGRDLLALANSLTGAGYRVILPDLPGYGRSQPPGRRFTHFDQNFYQHDATVMGTFLATLSHTHSDGRRTHILGFSDGGEVALLMPILRPDLCRSVAAWGAIGAYTPQLADYARNTMPHAAITPSVRARHPGQHVERWQVEWIDAVCAIIDAGGDVSLTRAGEIACPLLLMVGEHDDLNPVASVQRFVEATNAHKRPGERDNRHHVFAGAGHECHYDQPDAFLNVLLAFLKEVE